MAKTIGSPIMTISAPRSRKMTCRSFQAAAKITRSNSIGFILPSYWNRNRRMPMPKKTAENTSKIPRAGSTSTSPLPRARMS